MPRPLSKTLCGFVKSDLESGISDFKVLVDKYRISDAKARTMLRLFRRTGEVTDPQRRKNSGRKRKLNKEQEEGLLQFLNEHPKSFLKDMCIYIEDAYGIEVTETTMLRVCRRIGWTLQRQPKPRSKIGFWTRTLPRDEEDNQVPRRQPKKRPADYGLKLCYSRKMVLLDKTRDWVKEYMSHSRFDASHDIDHVQRVVTLSLEILRVQRRLDRITKYDAVVVELLALLHEVDDYKYQTVEDYPDTTHPSPSLLPNIPSPTIKDRLTRMGWPLDVASKVHAIAPFVSYTAETSDPDAFASTLAVHPELAIVQDADRLDAMGAVGIARAFTYGGAHQREGGLAASIDHFEEKLINLEARMKTEEGRHLAAARAERLRTFGRWWKEEMNQALVETGEMAWTQEPPPPPPQQIHGAAVEELMLAAHGGAFAGTVTGPNPLATPPPP